MMVPVTNTMPELCSRRTPYHYLTAVMLLMRLGVKLGNIELLAEGEYQNYRGEVLSQEPAPGAPLKKEARVSLRIGMSSAVDYMPFQFFYGLEGLRNADQSWDNDARRFMAPFESAYVKSKANAVMHQLKYDFGIVDPEYIKELLSLFDFEPGEFVADINEMLFWITAFPSFHFWAGNPYFVEKILTYLFGYKFRIIENVTSEFDIPGTIQYRLGTKAGRLAHETILGRRFSEQDSGYRLEISGVPSEKAVDLLPGKPLRKKIEWILGFCMPGNLECHMKIEINRSRANIGRDRKNCYLGYSSFVTGKR